MKLGISSHVPMWDVNRSRSTSNVPLGDGALQVEPLDRHGPNGYERDPPHATDARTSRHDIKNIRISALRFQAPSSVCSASESNHMKIINVASKTYFPKQGVARVGFLLIFIRITIGIQDVFSHACRLEKRKRVPRLPTGVSASAAHWSECLGCPLV